MEALHEFHACDGVRLPFGTACTTLGQHGQDIITQAAVLAAARSGSAAAAGWLGARSPVVTAPLERDGERSATMAMRWIPGGPADGDPAGWLHAHLRLLPRQRGGEAITELLLTVRCEVSPAALGAFDPDHCAGFLRNAAAELERRAAARPAR